LVMSPQSNGILKNLLRFRFNQDRIPNVENFDSKL
jgi:hypothetical protein